ncbi:MAG: hypothetical protein ACPLSJ_07490 [Thermosulfidibacteraceae bacterium]|jgi:hypothetical protein
MKKLKKAISGLVLFLFLTSCASYESTVQPVKLPEFQKNAISVDGVKMAIEILSDPQKAKDRFGFDIRSCGILPVIVTIENGGKEPVTIESSQTFLIDEDGNGWPILNLEEVYSRIESNTDVAEALKGTAKPALLGAIAGSIIGAGIAILSDKNVGEYAGKGAVAGAAVGAVTGGMSSYSSLGEKIREDIANKNLTNRSIQPGELVYGILFFPGKSNEAKNPKKLRLSMMIGKTRKIVTLD